MALPPALDDRIDQLYAGPTEAFIEHRDDLARELKVAGDKDAATMIKALRKPTAAAAAVNRLAHSAPRDVAELLEVGGDLRTAHEALAEGRGDAGIRLATSRRRKLVADLTDRAVALVGKGGEAQRDAISTTLDAAVADAEAGISVQEGRLTRELSAPSGFGADLVFPAPSPAPAPKVHRNAVAARRRRVADATRECERRTAEAERAARDASAARQEVGRLEGLLDTAKARSRIAEDAARLAQSAAAAAQQSLRDIERDDSRDA
ncbi:MAG TPA: hypothetical protein VM143_14890 [Acidimicrobiales bacterium]|nr:hypothetical protein [Acidimicrobiales bacterium]